MGRDAWSKSMPSIWRPRVGVPESFGCHFSRLKHVHNRKAYSDLQLQDLTSFFVVLGWNPKIMTAPWNCNHERPVKSLVPSVFGSPYSSSQSAKVRILHDPVSPLQSRHAGHGQDMSRYDHVQHGVQTIEKWLFLLRYVFCEGLAGWSDRKQGATTAVKTWRAWDPSN